MNDLASKVHLEARLAEARDVLQKYVKSEANAEMLTVLIRTIETLLHGFPKTPMRSHHHE